MKIDADYTTIKYDNDGNELWVRKYDGPVTGNLYDEALAITTDAIRQCICYRTKFRQQRSKTPMTTQQLNMIQTATNCGQCGIMVRVIQLTDA